MTSTAITDLDLGGLRDLLRAPFAEEGLDIDEFRFNVRNGQTLWVATSFELDGPCEGSFRDVLEMEHAFERDYLHDFKVCSILAMLAGMDRVPRTDYLVSW